MAKQLITVVYINVDNIPISDVPRYMDSIRDMFDFDLLVKEMKNPSGFCHEEKFFVPVLNQNTKFEFFVIDTDFNTFVEPKLNSLDKTEELFNLLSKLKK